ncbi:hypothetical protein VaNZ11_006337 [Volvox africanus]|uniref:Uncharacterized protein n=1 Tax=Volvox africanus TaxID=51714 RepID=A0ABQ5S1L7_9CHLO|nr:hypothetical protein VaNZ11_006337 [Volvox africanus]
MHLPDSSRELLTEGADPRINAPVIAINRMRKGAVRAMVAQVRRFRRIIPGTRPWWQAAAAGLLMRIPFLLLAYAAGYVQGRRAQRHGAIGGAAGLKSADRGEQSMEKSRRGSDAGYGPRSRLGVKLLPFWPIRKSRREAAVMG